MEARIKVLIADSSEEFSCRLKETLKGNEAYEVVGIANDGEQALEQVKRLQPDILVLDLMLAKRDGISILKAMNNLDRKPLVLATSGFWTEYVGTTVANLGVRYLMLKPCDMTALVERLDEIRLAEKIRSRCRSDGPSRRLILRRWSPISFMRSASRPTSRGISTCERPL